MRLQVKPLAFIQIELTNHCNYSCRFCPQSQWRSPQHEDVPYDREKGFMPFNMFREIIEQAHKVAGGINFSFFGEPMMHPEIVKILDHLKDRDPGLKVVMNTNLSLATKTIFEKLIEIKLDELRLSIDAASSHTYEIVRPGNYGLDLNGNSNKTDRFELIKKKALYWFSIPNHRPTRHVFTVNSKNQHEMEAFAKQWLPQLGNEDKILFKNILSYGGKIFDDMVCPNSCNVWDMHSLTIDWQGRVTPCNLDTNMDLCLGSILHETLLELLSGKKMREFESLSRQKKIAPCINCIDANNWSRNIILHKGDEFNLQTFQNVYGSQFK